MVDLHTHILPGMDDGSRNIETTNELLSMEEENGVKKIAFTPHFLCFEETVESFLKRREDALSLVTSNNFMFKAAAEVYYAIGLHKLTDEELLSLCLEDTNYFYLELSSPSSDVITFIERLKSLDITPILVHVERYPFLMDDLKQLEAFVNMGCVCQINCSSLLGDTKLKKHMLKLIKMNLVHLIATDTHSVIKRPVNMMAALSEVPSSDVLVSNAEKIFNGEKIEIEVKRKTWF